MRKNLPVTPSEYNIPSGAALLSTTDAQGHITYANAASIQASGFDNEELLGQPHNIVRHPDMPPQVFEDMWATLQAGHAWSALIKNRRKNGDFYWTRTSATPVMRHGALVGYTSVRTQPTREDVDEAAALYRDLLEGQANNRRLHRGLLVRTGWLGWMSLLQTMPVRWRLRGGVLAMLALCVAGATACGLHGAALAGFTACAAAAALLSALWLDMQIAHPLKRILDQSLAIAAGQAGRTEHLNRVDDIGMILRVVTQTGLNLRALVDDVSAQLDGLSQAASVITSGNGDLSERSEQAMASLDQIAASIEQMTAAVKNNADTSTQASQLASAASQAAATGGTVVDEVVGTMGAITESSHKIREIIAVIDGIAFQTNILALNAAVEAARAGEQGRGFAVVASEVRSLAQRSAEAAKEIASLIHHSVQRIDAGSELVNRAGAAMHDIVAQVAHVTNLIDTISTATQEQANGVDLLNTTIVQLDKVTHQNTALAQQSKHATDGFQDRMAKLANAISVFRSLSGGSMGQAAALPAQPPVARTRTAASAPAAPATPAPTPAPAVSNQAGAPAKPTPKPKPKASPSNKTDTVKSSDWTEF